MTKLCFSVTFKYIACKLLKQESIALILSRLTKKIDYFKKYYLRQSFNYEIQNQRLQVAMKIECVLGKFCELHKTTSTHNKTLQCICRFLFEIADSSANKSSSKIHRRLRIMLTFEYETLTCCK